MPSIIILPASIALIFKLALLGYSIKSPTKNLTTRLFLVLLTVLALHNVSEILGLNYFVQYGITPAAESYGKFYGFAYFALLIPAIALILHVSLQLSFDTPQQDPRTKLQYLLYLPGVVLLFLLLFTDKLVLGFQPFKNTVLRVPGPWYSLFETYLTVYLLAAIANLFYGARSSRTYTIRRIRNRLWLLGLLPMGVLVVYLIIANHFGLAKITSTIYLPIAITFLLVVTTYATHEYRLFDIEFFIPGSKIRKRKTVFYKRIQATIAEIADLRSVKEIVQHLAEVLSCPIALVASSRPVPITAMAGEALGLARFPRDELVKISHIVVANEIESVIPELYGLMTRHKVAAIVPFSPHSQAPTSWMLLGSSFSDQVYTPHDFRLLENLFERLADHFLDKQLLLRSQLAEARSERHNLQQRLATAWDQLEKTRSKLETVEEENKRLRAKDIFLFNQQIKQIEAEMLKNGPSNVTSLDEYVESFETKLIATALEYTNGHQSKAAELLGMRPNTLYYKIGRYKITKHSKDG